MPLKTLENSQVEEKQVLLRCDLNVPIKDGKITDDGRIRASLPTIKYLLEKRCSIVVVAHLGRPKGERKPELSLAPVAKRLSELLQINVKFIGSARGAKDEVNSLKRGEVALLENIRYESAETSKVDSERQDLAEELSTYAQYYVSDGFGAVHRKHASVYDVAKLLPHCAGFLVSAEVQILKKLTINPDRPYGVVLGGAKVSDKIGVINNLIDKVDLIAIGGGMVFTFLAAKGYQVGKSLLESEMIDEVKSILQKAESAGVKILLPNDIVVGDDFTATAVGSVVLSDAIPNDKIGMDIGPESAKEFANQVLKCKTVFWNGPMGVFEFPNFASGTKVVADSLTKVDGVSVVGGGDSAAAVRKLGFNDSDFGYISTGGGASLEYLEGKDLPGLKVLE